MKLTAAPFRDADADGQADTGGWSGLARNLRPLDGPEPPRWDDSTLHEALERVPAPLSAGSDETRRSSRSRLFGAREAVRLGRLELIARIGAGGMGEVYAARDLELGREVAVKIMRSDAGGDRRDATARIIREAQMMARVTHPNVVRVYDVGRIESRVYITMEYVQGCTLREWIEKPRTWREVLGMYLRAGRGLAAAHRMGLVHRDFKPSNVLVGDDERVLVADFGLARTIAEPETSPMAAGGSSSSSSSSSSSGSAASASSSRSGRLGPAELNQGGGQPTPNHSPPALITVHGTVLGTPGYMSPEQLHAAPVDARSDLFSFCVALYEALHGVRPYAGRTLESLLANIDGGKIVPPLRRVRIPGRLSRAIHRGLAADPSRRFATMDDLLGELERALRRPGRVLGASVGLAAALVAGGAVADIGPFADDDPCASAGTELAAVWNDGRRAELQSSFAATGLDFADDAAVRVGARLDEYTGAWSRSRVEACQATEVRHEQSAQLFDLRMVCLERRRQAVAALVDTLTTADRTTVEQAVDSLATLPLLEPCDDAAWLIRSVRPPEDPEVAAAVARARATIAQADALSATGHFREGLMHANDAVTQAAKIDHEPLRAEAMALRGRLLGQVGELVEAEATLLAAVELAEGTLHDELAADIWLDLVRLANQSLVDSTRAAAWIPRARAGQRRLGDPAARRLMVMHEEAILLFVERRHEEAQQIFRAGLALHAEIGGDARTLGRMAHNYGNALEANGQLAEARAAHERALPALEAAFGVDHPVYAAAQHDLAALLIVLGELDEAESRLQRALEIYTRTFGPMHHLVGRMHIALVEVALRREAFDQAVVRAETAAKILRAALPEGHTIRADAEVALGTARFFAGQLEGALASYLTARELQRKVKSPDPLSLAVTVCDIGETEVALSRHEEALASFAEVERVLAEASIQDLDLEARVLTGRGKIALAGNDVPRARALLEEAMALRQQIPEDPLALAELREALQRVNAR